MSAFKDSGHHWWQQCDSCEMAWFIGDEPCDGKDTEATCKRCDAPAPPAEPTTAEAFSTVRGALSSFRGLIEVFYSDHKESDGSVERGCTEAVTALALLERRTQEMEARLAEVDTHWSHPGTVDV